MQKFKKYLLISAAILIIVLIIALPLLFKNKNTKTNAQTNAVSQAEILGASSVTPTPESSILPSATPKPPTPKPTPGSSVLTPPSATPTAPQPTSTPNPTPAPTPTPAKTVTVDIQNLGVFTVDIGENDTAYDALINAGKQNGFTVTSDYYVGMGYFVTGIGTISSHDNYFWAFYYNGASSMVGASTQKVAANDTTAWKFENW